jgi:hypothetical protein
MLRVRSEQVAAFEDASAETFEDLMVEHAARFFPKHLRMLGEPVIRKVVHYGVARAELCGFKKQREACLYLNLMLSLGSHFDTDIQLPWVEAALRADPHLSPSARADRLVARARDYFDRLCGPQGAYVERARIRIRDELPRLKQGQPAGVSDFEAFALPWLRSVYPKRYDLAGEHVMRAAVRQSVTAASAYGITRAHGAALFTLLSFILGSRFAEDPQFAWVTPILGDDRSREDAKVERLHEEAAEFLDAWMK